MEHFQLKAALAKPGTPVAHVAEGADKAKTVQLALYPQMGEDDDVFSEMIFLVDRSGSMTRDGRMDKTKQTLQIFLRSIPEGSLFNIVSFGTNHKSLFPQSEEYNEDSLAKATAHVTSMRADMGGTNISNPLEQLLKAKPIPGMARQIFLLTDGQVNNRDQCVSITRASAHTTRVFCFGIGDGVDARLVKEMAAAGNGAHELIASGDDMEAKVGCCVRR